MTQGSRLTNQKEHVPHLNKAENVLTVERVGIKILKVLYTVNIKMEFRHPKYYKELKEFGKRGDRGKPTAASPNTDQAISKESSTGENQRAPGPGLKQQAASDSQVVNQVKLSSQSQAASAKPQAPSSDKNS